RLPLPAQRTNGPPEPPGDHADRSTTGIDSAVSAPRTWEQVASAARTATRVPAHYRVDDSVTQRPPWTRRGRDHPRGPVSQVLEVTRAARSSRGGDRGARVRRRDAPAFLRSRPPIPRRGRRRAVVALPGLQLRSSDHSQPPAVRS